MLDLQNFKIWLENNADYSRQTVSNIVSRLKRADSILPWYNNTIYLFRLEESDEYNQLPSSVKSQIKKSVKLYFDFINANKPSEDNGKPKILSLFANIGIAEAYLERIGFDIEVANELISKRAALYSKIYPNTKTICGDITDEKVYDSIVSESLERNVDIIMATPPCQGMSTAGQQKEDDSRNSLILPVISMIKQINPKYVFIENVPMFYNTEIIVNGQKILIPDLIKSELGLSYKITRHVINTQNYSVPQARERAITLLSRNDVPEWVMPPEDKKLVTMRDAIGDLPPLDPFIKDITKEELLQIFPKYYERKDAALKISKWHIPPSHIKRQVIVMQHTKTGETAFDNEKYYPIKEDGTPVRGYHNTYKRQNWDTPAYTVTMDNRKISSQNNVHPGRLEYVNNDGEEIYSDARTLTLYELMRVMSLPEDWPIPPETGEAFLRRIIGEGIPPLFVKKVFLSLKEVLKHE